MNGIETTFGKVLASGAVLVLLLAGCTPIRPIYFSTAAEISVEPNYVCSGDPVDVFWDLNPPRHRDFCDYPAGGYPSAISCASNSDCPDGGRCSDGLCCASPIPLRECGPACPPDTESTVTFDPRGPTQTNPHASGRITFSPAQSTAITLDGEWGPPTTPKGPESTRVVVVDEPPLEDLVMGFSFACTGSGFGWSSFDLAPANVLPSAQVVITSVRNSSGRQIRLSDGVHPPVTLDAGSPPTNAFNGPLTGTTWSASLTSLGTVGLPMPRCTPVDESDPYPDLSVLVTLGCASNSP
jgi:hypothetical protein